MKKNAFPILLFTALAILILWDLHIFQILPKRPCSTHVWAQCDRASVARNFSEDSMNIFLPKTFNLAGGSRISGMEFPLMSFITAIFYKIFGFNELWYRLIMLITLISGLYFSTKIGSLFIPNILVALLLSFYWFLSPILDFYAANFIPDTASLGFALIGWYFFFKSIPAFSKPNLNYSFVFFTLSSLIKISSSINLFAIILLLLISRFENNTESFSVLYQNYKVYLKRAIISLCLVFAWYAYASWLNNHYKSDIFLLEINPVNSWQEFKSIFSFWTNGWFWHIYPKGCWIIIFGIIVLNILFSRKHNYFLFTVSMLLLAGSMLFVLLMFRQFRIHDYYCITLLPFVFFNLLLFLQFVHHRCKGFIFRSFIAVIGLTAFTYSLKNSGTYMYNHFFEDPLNKKISSYYQLESLLKMLNIKKTEPVAMAYDDSFNISLYFADHKGLNIQRQADENEVKKVLKRCDYLVSDTYDFCEKYKTELTFIASNGNFKVYAIKK